MNIIYGLLNKAAEIFGEPATLTKRDGLEIDVNLSAESPTTETLSGEYEAAQNELIFSASIADLTNDGATTYPEEGDVVTGLFGAPNPQRWRVTTDGTTATAWSWQWGRPGGRIQFKAAKISDDA